jgi:fumarate reductase flavoprotein subunit
MAYDYDVIVIGGGGAGMSAAVTACDAGARVALIEAGEQLGGSTALSGGVVYGAPTSVQRAAGITGDTADDMFEYYMTLNQHKVEPAIVRRLCDGSGPAIEWLISIGVEFDPGELYASGVERVARGHKATGNGAAIAEALDREVSRRDIDVSKGARVRRLHRDADGAVRGVCIGDETVSAAAVVIATGGFGHNRLLLNRYYPEAARHGDWTWAISAKTCVGDGLLMGIDAGADVAGYDRGLLLTTPGFYKDLEVFVPGWLVYVNREGRRFIDETTEYAVMSGVVKEQLGGTVFALFDEAARQTAEPEPRYAAAHKAGIITLNWVTDKIDEQIGKGRIIRADTLAELADRAGIESRTLETTVAGYNADIADGIDRRFHKNPALMKPVATPPFYAAEIRPAIVCLTSTGLRVDQHMRVLDRYDLPVAGLFAAGEVAGGVLGERYIGGGNSISNAIVFGQDAGKAAAAVARGNWQERAA